MVKEIEFRYPIKLFFCYYSEKIFVTVRQQWIIGWCTAQLSTWLTPRIYSHLSSNENDGEDREWIIEERPPRTKNKQKITTAVYSNAVFVADHFICQQHKKQFYFISKMFYPLRFDWWDQMMNVMTNCWILYLSYFGNLALVYLSNLHRQQKTKQIDWDKKNCFLQNKEKNVSHLQIKYFF